MKWYTCTPVAFRGGPDFFSRDSGLLSRGFHAMGFESCAIMPGEKEVGDAEGLIRTEYENLERADWWREQEIDGLVLYAWGRPRFWKVARAAREAGIRLVLNQDSGGLVSPRQGLKLWLEEQWIVSGAGRIPLGRLRFAKLVLWGMSAGLLCSDRLRLLHLSQGDWITAVSPVAAERYCQLGSFRGSDESPWRVAFVPHPVDPRFCHGDFPKEERLVSIGRWDDECQKRTSLLIRVLDRVIKKCSKLHVDLIGPVSEDLRRWHQGLGDELAGRVMLHGRLLPEQMVDLLQRAKVAYCSSAFESFHIASAEALCCGASVVAGRAISLASFEWFVSDGDGTLAESDDVAGHSQALIDEFAEWEAGRRDPGSISSRWCGRVHAPRVTARILELFDGEGIGSDRGKV